MNELMSDLAFAGAARREQLERDKKNAELGCAYPNCSNHKEGQNQAWPAHYCCNGCRWDHQDTDPSILDEVVIPDMFVAEASRWYDRAVNDGWKPEYCEIQVFMVLLNGACYATDFDPTQRYEIEKGQFDALWYVVDTTRMCSYLHETKFHSIARCYQKTDAKKIVKALNATQTKTARRKNG